jgi:glycosyltransferase involved in cell wall biosynthesis
MRPCSSSSESINLKANKRTAMDNAAKIAVIILTYNEARHLPRALACVTEFAEEVFVVDSFSTDNTVALAEQFGAKVFQHPFRNQAEQFSWALENIAIHSEWVMRLDADEVVEPDLAVEIRSKLPQLPPDVHGVNLKRKTIFQDKFIRHGGRYPLVLLRIWRNGKARIENRWMDEHLYLTSGRSVTFRGGFADHNLSDLTAFTEKHNRYASREALTILNSRLGLFSENPDLAAKLTTPQAASKRFLKESFYNRIPFEISAFAYFIYRYFLRLGFLDGKPGLVYHFLQAFWYRFLVGAKLRELEDALRRTGSDEEMRAEIARLTRQQLNV